MNHGRTWMRERKSAIFGSFQWADDELQVSQSVTRHNLLLRHYPGYVQRIERLIVLAGSRFDPEMKSLFILIAIRNLNGNGLFQPGNGQKGR